MSWAAADQIPRYTGVDLSQLDRPEIKTLEKTNLGRTVPISLLLSDNR